MKNILKTYKGIIDSTLREGQQYRFANFNPTQQKEIVQLLSAIGVDKIEVGNPITEDVQKTIVQLTHVKGRRPLLAHVRNRLEDIHAAQSTGVEGINILCSIEPDRLAAMDKTYHEYLDELRQGILFAQQHRLEVRVSVEHFFRSKNAQAVQVYKLAENLRVERIGIADTTGMAMHWEVTNAIKDLRKIVTTDIEVHFHNDLGQANSNAITALAAGASWVDTTLLGIGERNGIPALSTFLVSLYHLNAAIKQQYHLEKLTRAENTVAQMIGQDVPFNLLTNKANGFSHKAGIHINSLINLGPQTYELFSPSVIGNTRQVIHGTAISGKTTAADVAQFYQQYGRG
jgi:homocitrate synthase